MAQIAFCFFMFHHDEGDDGKLNTVTGPVYREAGLWIRNAIIYSFCHKRTAGTLVLWISSRSSNILKVRQVMDFVLLCWSQVGQGGLSSAGQRGDFTIPHQWWKMSSPPLQKKQSSPNYTGNGTKAPPVIQRTSECQNHHQGNSRHPGIHQEDDLKANSLQAEWMRSEISVQESTAAQDPQAYCSCRLSMGPMRCSWPHVPFSTHTHTPGDLYCSFCFGMEKWRAFFINSIFQT